MQPSIEQQKVVDAILNGKNVVIHAVAGAGKTTTMLMVAQRFLRKILILTYNKALQQDTMERIKKENLTHVECCTFHGYATKLSGCIVKNDEIMFEILQSKKLSENYFDLVMMDEVQDMRPLYWKLCTFILKTAKQAMIVGDPAQIVYTYLGQDSASTKYICNPNTYFPEFAPWEQINLLESFRMTQNMAEMLNELHWTPYPIKGIQSGDIPVKYIMLSKITDELIHFLFDKAKEYGPGNCMWIGNSVKFPPISNIVNKFTGIRDENNQVLKFSIGSNNKNHDKVNLSSFVQAKGREADFVVVFSVNVKQKLRLSLECAGVGLSRARKELVIVHLDQAYYYPPWTAETLNELQHRGHLIHTNLHKNFLLFDEKLNYKTNANHKSFIPKSCEITNMISHLGQTVEIILLSFAKILNCNQTVEKLTMNTNIDSINESIQFLYEIILPVLAEIDIFGDSQRLQNLRSVKWIQMDVMYDCNNMSIPEEIWLKIFKTKNSVSGDKIMKYKSEFTKEKINTNFGNITLLDNALVYGISDIQVLLKKPATALSPSELMYLTLVDHSLQRENYMLLGQIGPTKEHYSWVDEDFIQNARQRLMNFMTKFQKYCFYCKLQWERFVGIHGHTFCLFGNVNLIAIQDDKHMIVQFKSCEQLSNEDFIFLIVCCAIYLQDHPEYSTIDGSLINVFDNTETFIQVNTNDSERILSLLFQAKFGKLDEKMIDDLLDRATKQREFSSPISEDPFDSNDSIETNESIPPLKRYKSQPIDYIVFDFETDGFGYIPLQKPIQLAWQKFSDNFCVEKKCMMISGVTKINTEFHKHLTMNDVNHGHPIDIVLEHFYQGLNNSTFLVSHNISFDSMILKRYSHVIHQNLLHKMPKLCTMQASKKFCNLYVGKRLKKPSLTELALKCNVNIEDQHLHTADGDVEITVRCLHKLLTLQIIQWKEIK